MLNNASVNRAGVGWNSPYVGYRQGWVHGYWDGDYPGGYGWRRLGYGDSSFRGAGHGDGLAMGLTGWGLASWLYGPMIYSYGYWNYHNPYSSAGDSEHRLDAQAPALIADYAQPIDAQSTPPPQEAAGKAASILETARRAFTQAITCSLSNSPTRRSR